MRLRVVTFNIRHGLARDGWNSWPFRRRATAAVLRAADADVIGLQEALWCQARWLRRRLGGHGLTGDGRTARRGGERCSVLFRRPRFALVSSRTRWYGDEPDRPGTRLPGASFPRVATIVVLTPTDGGPPFTVVNTHLDEHHDDNRTAAARQLVGWLPDGPAVVVGDLNAGPDSRAVRVLEEAGLRSVLGPDAPGTGHRFTGTTEGKRIDHILVSDHWEVRSGRVVTDRPGGRLPSDHWPVLADLDLRA